MILALIIACEISFWIAILAGLAVRYIRGNKRLGSALLLAAPLIDLVLLVAVTAHLLSGASASWHHGLAALYIGFSATYGHRMVAWADVRFAHQFAGGAAPVKVIGWEYTRRCWADLLRTLGAVLIAGGILAAISWWVGDPARTGAFNDWIRIFGIVLAAEFLWSLSYTVWPRKASSKTIPSSR